MPVRRGRGAIRAAALAAILVPAVAPATATAVPAAGDPGIPPPACPSPLDSLAPWGVSNGAWPCRADGGSLAAPPRTSAPSPAPCVEHEALGNRCHRWVDRYDGTRSGYDGAVDVAAGAEGAAYVTGFSEVPYDAWPGYGYEYVTIAHDATTGERRWLARYGGPTGFWNIPSALALSADGGRLFVTGTSSGAEGADYATVAYDAATGQRLWEALYDGPGAGTDIATALAVSPDDALVYVTGTSYTGPATGYDYATVAYDAATGEQRWEARHAGERNYEDNARWVGVSPDGERVVVAGTLGPETNPSFGLVAYGYEDDEGDELVEIWTASYDTPGNHAEVAEGFGMSPSGDRVYVAGEGWGADQSPDATTVAFDAATGAIAWVARDDPADWSGATSLAVGPDGTIFVGGWTFQYRPNNLFGDYDFLTLAYAPDGTRRWMTRFDGPGMGNDAARAVTATADAVYVTGPSQPVPSSAFGLFYDYVTLAYEAASGDRRWVARYDSLDQDIPTALATDGERVVVTGASFDPLTAYDFATLSYDA